MIFMNRDELETYLTSIQQRSDDCATRLGDLLADNAALSSGAKLVVEQCINIVSFISEEANGKQITLPTTVTRRP